MFPEQQYKEVYSNNGIKLFVPHNTTTYHTSRVQEAMKQNIYANNGIGQDALEKHIDAIIELCNQTGELKTIRTDIASVAQALKMRMKYPVDEHCAVRMGITLTFIQIEEDGMVKGENPDKVEWYWMQKKEKLAFEFSDLYAFFLTLGVSSIPRYSEALSTLSDTDYLMNRMMKVREMLPEKLRHLCNS